MTRDDFAIKLLKSGRIGVNLTAGKIFRIHDSYTQELKQHRHYKGHMFVTLQFQNERKKLFVHRLIFMALNNKKIPRDKCVCHKDNDKTNNCIDNLYLATSVQNSVHARIDGLYKNNGKHKKEALIV